MISIRKPQVSYLSLMWKSISIEFYYVSDNVQLILLYSSLYSQNLPFNFNLQQREWDWTQWSTHKCWPKRYLSCREFISLRNHRIFRKTERFWLSINHLRTRFLSLLCKADLDKISLKDHEIWVESTFLQILPLSSIHF